jgi:hypothetical protein
MKVISRDYPAALELFDRLFSRIEMTDKSIDPLTLAYYAYALARTGDTRASTVAPQAEEKIRTEAPSSLPKRTALAWWPPVRMSPRERGGCYQMSSSCAPAERRPLMADL